MSIRDVIDDRAYFTRPARQERAAAAIAEDDAVALSHLKLAAEDERRVGVMMSAPTLSRPQNA